MKKFFITLLALSLLFSVSCTKEVPEDIPEEKQETVELSPIEQVREYINNEEFEKAYELLLTLNGEEAEELLERFSYLPEKHTEVDYGENTTTTTYSYDKHGNVVKKTVVSPSGERVTKFEYDEGGRLLSKVETHPSAHVEKVVNTYDEKGNPLTYTEYVDGHLDFKQEMRYDENSNLIYKAISGYIETEETLEYNKKGLLTLSVIKNLLSGAEEKTVFEYDELDRLLKRTYTDQSDMYEVSYTYTDDGKIETETDRGEIISIKVFDKGDRELYAAYPANKTGLIRAEYEYNENGNIERRYQLTVNARKELEETETVWKYADANNLYKIPESSLYSETTTTAEGDVYTEVYTYDETGKLEMVEGKKNGEWQYSRMYSYGNMISNRSEDYYYRFTYDNKNNLLKREDAMSSYSEEYENYKLYYNPNK